ncbi:MAG: helix-turn-helix domain-containing protein [Clostridia bacterium]|nr:helix-turn-helix domain-containing protein [Clostridia bacterium]
MEKKQLLEIGHRLRTRRQELGLTREKMSELADIGSGYYGQLEVGTSQMSVDTLIKLSRSMHLPIEYILFGDDYEKGDPSALIDLLKNCTPRELSLAEEVLKLFLMKNN